MAREDDFTSTVEGAAGWARAHGRGGDYGDAPSRGEAEADEAYLRGEVRRVEPEARGVRCGSCKGRHATPGDVRDCYAAARSAEDDAHAEMIAEQQAERAYAEDRERIAERGTWFGPQTEADSWGEDDDALTYATAIGYTGECEDGHCDVYNRCKKHRAQDVARGDRDGMFRSYND